MKTVARHSVNDSQGTTAMSADCGDGILDRHFNSRLLGINSRLLRLKFLSGFLPIYKKLFMNRLEFSCFADFFVGILKTREEFSFLKDSSLFLN
jgi:hypothetical protein